MALLLVLLAAVADPRTGVALTFPLVVDYQILKLALTKQLGGTTEADACSSVTLRDVDAERVEANVRLALRGSARAGLRLFGFCLLPVSWDGYLDVIAEPSVDEQWRLKLRVVDSELADRNHRRTVVGSRVWDLVKGGVTERLDAFVFDLRPPVEDVRAVLRAFAPPARAAALVTALESARPLPVSVRDDAIQVPIAIDLPAPAPSPVVPEPALNPAELARWQAALDRWDAFLVFAIKDVGLATDDPEIHDELLDLLLGSRHQLVAIVAAGPQPGVDPVRRLFVDTWDRFRTIIRRAAAAERGEDRALRYVTFIAAGDALALLDATGPDLGIDISADGLRRLARLLEPEYPGDPTAYSEAPDPALRELFRFHEPAEPPPAPALPDAWWWPAPRAAHADVLAAEEWGALVRRLDRWVPTDDELAAYRDAVAKLLSAVATGAARANGIDDRFAVLYAHLVPTVAWQESCWRQFVRNGDDVTFLLSKTGDIGIMQVNRRVWRGFFDVDKLRWDIAYNAGAGAEILAQLLARYGAREANERLENAARATYSAYNGGPGAYRRYRQTKVPRVQRAIDRAFWDKYRRMAAGEALDFVLCVENWGTTPRAQVPIAAAGSMPTRCASSRRSLATSSIVARHSAIASRPRARRV
ncbi:MAG TPA: lytic transglycosylase domain-containing protein [Candidatus Binatia bacterium]|nr:lytic transglycosylase domain-containing protein [Candidatus Binatia bacterium]